VRIADYAATDLIATGLEAHDKDDLLQKMVEMLVQSGRVRQSDILMGELQKRERVMSTGIGGGIALPHALSNEVDNLEVVFARTSEPLEFEALDSNPVDLVVMLVGPKLASNVYVKLLARVSRLLQGEEFKQRLRDASSAEEILEVFRSAE
jgi:mannitol/fructose-specific phosphotransferase system IIA component (Ntr-type)